MKVWTQKPSANEWSVTAPNPSAMASASTKDNNIYLGDLAENAIGVIKADRSYQRLAQSPELSWVSQSKPPYFLIEVKALAAGLPGW